MRWIDWLAAIAVAGFPLLLFLVVGFVADDIAKSFGSGDDC